jgi:hypothetical protein
MLIYHFGSREGLLIEAIRAAVDAAMERYIDALSA